MLNVQVKIDSTNLLATKINFSRSWIWATEGVTQFVIGESEFAVRNLAGTIYLALYRALPAILEPVPADLRHLINADAFSSLDKRASHLIEHLKSEAQLDPDAEEVGDCLEGLWEWKMRRTIEIDRVIPEPNLWAWCDGSQCFIECLLPPEYDDTANPKRILISYAVSKATLVSVCDQFREQLRDQVKENLVRRQLDAEVQPAQLANYLAALAEPFTVESIIGRTTSATDWDKVRYWYRRLESDIDSNEHKSKK